MSRYKLTPKQKMMAFIETKKKEIERNKQVKILRKQSKNGPIINSKIRRTIK